MVKDYTRGGLLDTNKLTVTVTYPQGGLNSLGSTVRVRGAYPYDPFTVLPLGVTMGSHTTSLIVY